MHYTILYFTVSYCTVLCCTLLQYNVCIIFTREGSDLTLIVIELSIWASDCNNNIMIPPSGSLTVPWYHHKNLTVPWRQHKCCDSTIKPPWRNVTIVYSYTMLQCYTYMSQLYGTKVTCHWYNHDLSSYQFNECYSNCVLWWHITLFRYYTKRSLLIFIMIYYCYYALLWHVSISFYHCGKLMCMFIFYDMSLCL